MKEFPIIQPGELFVQIDGEGVCDYCFDEIDGNIFHFEKHGDFCDKCMAILVKKNKHES